MMRRQYISLGMLLVLVYVLFRVAHMYPRWTKSGSEATLSWDVFGYYLYLPAVLIHDDLDDLAFRDKVMETYRPAGDFHHAKQVENGKFVMKYPTGMSLAYLPWFTIGHIWAGWTEHPQDGFSRPYQQAIQWGCMLVIILGLFLLRRLLLFYFSDMAVAGALGVLVLASNFLNYASLDAAMTHGTLFTLFIINLNLSRAWHQRPRLWLAALLGLIIGWSTIIRPTELMSVLFPLLWGVENRAGIRQKWQLLLQNWSHVLVLGLCIAAMGMIQLGYWKSLSGNWFFYSYEEGFDWLKPHIWDGIFSYKKGWLMYSPAMILSLIGFGALYFRQRPHFWMVLTYTVINIYVVFSWQNWWYGGGFGARPLVQSYALLAFPLAACMSWALDKRTRTILVGVFVLLCIDLNMTMTWQAHSKEGIWQGDGLTKAYYWRIFGKTEVPRMDRKYLDVRRSLGSSKGMDITGLYVNDFESDTTAHRSTRQHASGQYAALLNGAHQYTPSYAVSVEELDGIPGSWLRVEAMVYYEQMEWNLWQMAQLSMVFTRDGKPYRQTTARIQRAVEPWRWTHFDYEMRIPHNAQPGDVVKVYVWNAGGQREVFVDDLKVWLLKP